MIELFVGKIEREHDTKRGKTMHCLGFRYPSQKKNVFSLSKPSFVSSSHFIHPHRGLRTSLSSREVKTTTNDFYDDLDDDGLFFFSLSLSLFMFVCLGKH